ncbi:hypothetical protein FH593_10600 [Leptospira interrogans]|uniref:Phage tail collar domain protein n=2 Tax=Leptospira interrogans serovar Pyrogenes TaxID=280500 RepID=M7A1Q7_LEPIR|nr:MULTISPECIES: hypothetical protein [Leptospira]EMN29139.1 hypothetical protein LEP1GSC083_0741 [Leptospira interrogans serovar Pyrogenes str. L0374]EMP07965.1 hypothetical protein LEP1GSC124_5265 [Leptospira interrogans serovar Pyrogenes str. 200701872]EKO07813.1 hypothetical protein LEP1GSC077_3548 [Leptospira interrogans str. C10069]EMN64848.1 hypothetical protein LEP1GSC092_1139 [Leptospira interrogans serovar Pyrogenes str. R168]MCL8311606.1 hypothetical protein [Leptospira interrogans]
MAVFNPVKTRTWSKNTPADGDLIDDEFDRQYENFQYLKDRIDSTDINLANFLIPIGSIIEDGLNLAPSINFKDANAQAISRNTFVTLWNSVHRVITGIVPTTDRISCTNHGCIEGQLVKFSFTGGGVSALVNYYVRNPTTNDFQISSTATGSILDLTSSQTGEMIINVEYGFGDGSTTYNIPDRRGIFARGAGVHGTRGKAAGGNYDGGAVGYAGQDQTQPHLHASPANGGLPFAVIGSGSSWLNTGSSNSGASSQTGIMVSDGTNGTPRTGNETTPAFIAVKYKVRVL